MAQALGFLFLLGGGVLVLAAYTGASPAQVVKGEAGTKGAKLGGGQSSQGGGAPGASGAAGGFLSRALSQIGVPYQWGGEIERVAFDCSGLVQWAAKQVGVSLPRTAEAQFNAVQKTATPAPGELVFFREPGGAIGHVGIISGVNEMVDAPHTGASVRRESVPLRIGASWGSDTVAGFGVI